MTSTPDSPSIRSLAPFAVPGDPAYQAATATFNLAAPLNPLGALVAHSTEDVVAAVKAAAALELPLYVFTTGHASGAVVGAEAGLLVRAELSAPVTIDAARKTATVAAGTRWAAVAVAAATEGLAALHGSSGTVGVVGYLLGGGMSMYGRRFGVAANSLLAVTVVVADGSVVRATATENHELFWAIRGGRSGFGIVTEVEIRLYPMAQIVTGGTFWDAKHAAAIIPIWRRWAEQADPRISTSLRLMNLPAMPGVPEMLTQGQILVLDGAITAETEAELDSAFGLLAELIDPLKLIAEPLLETWHPGSPVELLATHMDPQEPIPFIGNHMLLRELDDAAIAGIIETAGPESGSPLLMVELRQLGGAFATPVENGGAFDHIDAAYAFIAGWLAVPELHETGTSFVQALRSTLAPWNTGFTAPTFVENSNQPHRTFDDETASRVAAIRTAVDPNGLFA